MIQNEIIKVSPVQQQDYTQWLEYWVAYQNFYQVGRVKLEVRHKPPN
ncbi:hypothetical protein J671_4059 [Acinetobacter sp. 1130196]|nr:hypothetical protein J671_4059 [Acinetobacter sp. 1130196]